MTGKVRQVAGRAKLFLLLASTVSTDAGAVVPD